MMPFAFDLISTLVIGSTLPVATTDRVIVPRSTVAILDGSMAAEAPFSVEKPQDAAATTSDGCTAARGRISGISASRPRGKRPCRPIWDD